MKKLGVFQLGLTFSGCFLGAGYVSGQEMWQFFGQYGINGLFGLLVAILLLSCIGAVTLLLAKHLKCAETDVLIISGNSPVLRWIVFLLEAVFLFCVCIIMTAGVGALCNDIFGIQPWLGCAVFTLAVMIISFTGLNGMVTAFSATVPVLVLVTLLFCIHFAIKGDLALPSAVTEFKNPLLSFWPASAILFACYNVFGSIAILAPLGPYVNNNKTVFRGIIFGALILFTVAVSVLLSVASAGTQAEELPMLSLALKISRPLGWIYGFLLLLAMFGTCLSCLIAFIRSICEKWQRVSAHSIPFHLFCAVVIFFSSLIGFGDLIGVIYPLFGYCSSIFIILLVWHYFRIKTRTSVK